MPVPVEWERLRELFAELALAAGEDVPQRFGGTLEALYCFPQIGQTIRNMGQVKFNSLLSAIWVDNTAGRNRMLAQSRAYFARLMAGDKITESEAKVEWNAVRDSNPARHKENPESAVVYGLAMMLAAD